MRADLTRRAFFKGMVGGVEPPDSTPENQHNYAVISKACLEFQGVTCRRCGEVCDPGAIRFQPQGRGLFHPVVDINQCTSCSECLKICPVHAVRLNSLESLGADAGGGANPVV